MPCMMHRAVRLEVRRRGGEERGGEEERSMREVRREDEDERTGEIEWAKIDYSGEIFSSKRK